PTGLGAHVIRISRACDDGWRLDLDRWRAEAKAGARLLVFANLGNPTSEALSQTEIGEVAEIAEESEAYVLVDETFRELAFERRPPSVAQFGPRMIALSTITKVCGLGTLRAGWIVAEPNLLERFGRIKDYTSGGNSALGQLVASWALERWEFFLRRARRILTRNRKVLTEALGDMPDLKAEVPSHGTVLFPHSRVEVGTLATAPVERCKSVTAERSHPRPEGKTRRDRTGSLRGRRYGELENRQTGSHPRAELGDGQPPGGQPRLQDDSAARCLDPPRSDGPRAVRNEGRARPT